MSFGHPKWCRILYINRMKTRINTKTVSLIHMPMRRTHTVQTLNRPLAHGHTRRGPRYCEVDSGSLLELCQPPVRLQSSASYPLKSRPLGVWVKSNVYDGWEQGATKLRGQISNIPHSGKSLKSMLFLFIVIIYTLVWSCLPIWQCPRAQINLTLYILHTLISILESKTWSTIRRSNNTLVAVAIPPHFCVTWKPIASLCASSETIWSKLASNSHQISIRASLITIPYGPSPVGSPNLSIISPNNGKPPRFTIPNPPGCLSPRVTVTPNPLRCFISILVSLHLA